MFSTLIIGVNVDSRNCYTRVLTLKKGKILHDELKEFRTVPGDIPIEAAKFIRKLRKKHPFTYVATLSHSIHQGAIDTIRADEYLKFGIRSNEVRSVIVQEAWSAYISREGIAEARGKFAKSQGVDFLFSPFALLYEGIKGRLDEKKRLYVLQQQSDLALAIMNAKGLYFGGFFILESEMEASTEKKPEEEMALGETPLEPASPAKITEALSALDNELEEIGELEELDDSVMIEDFEEHEAPLPKHNEKEEERSALDDFARAISVAKFIKDSLSEFYKNEVYRSDFIDEIVILDTYGISSGALTYLKNTLLIDIKTHALDVTSSLVKMAELEIKEREGGARGI
ncbi:hypothetical protein [Wolinella succinogenes]|nr:hypothetical protein [Wolinella succinogenes]NLU35329.1 hypothetical protein [Wolinella succinogenes]VEG80950.1 Uncharacterised protein [Wolinella succinogenes]HCZ18554.1 hypothetical protein [Helicobacter sp.]